MNQKTTTRTCVLILATLAMISMFTGSATASFTPSSFVSFTLEGCRNDGTITLPNGSGQFICPDAAYTTGNLGKGWNELDLVPHRLTTGAGSQRGVTTDYDVYVAADYQTSGKIGYDVLTFFQVNTGKSDSSCTLSLVGPNQFQGTATTPFGGGTDTVIYQQLHIHQNAGTTCVFDWVNRLALGAHLYPGSSLQSYMFPAVGLSGSKKTLSIPVNQILPQDLSKTMTATQGATNTWQVGKNAPASLDFPDVCDPNAALSKQVTINVSWTKTTTPGGIQITTIITATNPASRSVDVSVTDQIYLGALNDTSTPIDQASAGPVTVAANTSTTVLTHTFTDTTNTSATQYWDQATATYTDTATGIPVPGQTTAKAAATVQVANGQNTSAVITDQEDITGTGWAFSLDSFSGTLGYTGGSVTAPSGYAVGTNQQVTSLTWTGNSVLGDGTATFKKTVAYSGSGPSSAKLTDTASLLGIDGFTTDSGQQTVAVSAEALVNLTINKSIASPADVTFTFHVFDSTDTEVNDPSTGNPPFIQFTSSGSTSGSVTLKGLQPDTYTVTEDAATGWVETDSNSHTVALSGTSSATCSNSVSFTNAKPDAEIVLSPLTATNNINDPHTITATVSQDDAFPAGSPHDGATGFGPAPDGTLVTFSLLNNNAGATFVNNVSTCTTTGGTCTVQINSSTPGTVDIHATTTFSVDGVSLTRATGDGLSGDSADASKKYVAAVLHIKKVTLPSGLTTSFTFTPTGWNSGNTFQLTDGQSKSSGNVAPGTYSAAETVPSGFALASTDCVATGTTTAHAFTSITNGVSVTLAADDDVTCTFTNVKPDAKIVLSPLTATNPVNQQHTITATVSQDDQYPAGAPHDGTTGFGPAPDGTLVTFSLLNNTANASFVNNTSTCTTVGGTCSVSINSSTPGSVDIHATTTFSVDTVSLTRATGDGISGDSSNASKTYQAAVLRIKKVTVPSGLADSFTFTPSGGWNGGSTFLLSDGQTKSSGNIAPGTYGATETVPSTFNLTNRACVLTGTTTAHAFTATTNGVSVVLAAGEDVTCTFTNNKLATIIIKKITKPANTGVFTFTVTGNSPYAGFNLAGGGTNTQGGLTPGTYTVKEGTQLGWILDAIGSDPADPNNPTACSVSGSGGSTGTGNVSTQTATISLNWGDTVTCVFENTGQGATRTQGFWATHPQLANIAWFGGTAFGHTFPGVVNTPGIGDTSLCGTRVINDLGKLMGGFWSAISKTSTGAQRSSLDQGRMQLLQQLLAAELNASAFGSVPSGGSAQFASWEAAYCGTNAKTINNAVQQAGSFNSTGDNSTFTPGTAADSKTARFIANIPFWDVLP